MPIYENVSMKTGKVPSYLTDKRGKNPVSMDRVLEPFTGSVIEVTPSTVEGESPVNIYTDDAIIAKSSIISEPVEETVTDQSDQDCLDSKEELSSNEIVEEETDINKKYTDSSQIYSMYKNEVMSLASELGIRTDGKVKVDLVKEICKVLKLK